MVILRLFQIKDGLKVDPKCVVYKQKCIDYIEKLRFMVIFLYNLFTFVWIQHSYLAKMVFALDPSNSATKRLWCILYK